MATRQTGVVEATFLFPGLPRISARQLSATVSNYVYTLSNDDNGMTLTFSKADAQVVVVPSTLSEGFSCTIIRGSTGMLHFFPKSGVTLVSSLGWRVDTGGTVTVSVSGGVTSVSGNLASDQIVCGGMAVASFANDNQLSNPYDCIQNTTAQFFRNQCVFRGVTARVTSPASGSSFIYQAFRANGATYDYVGESEDFTLATTADGNRTKWFSTPVYSVRPGDRLGFYSSDGTSASRQLVKTGGGTKFTTGHITTSDTFGSSTAYDQSVSMLSSPVLIGTTGDSIMAGSNTASYWTSYVDGGPSGTIGSEIPHGLVTLIGTGFEYQNHASSGRTFAWCLSTGVPALITAKCAWIWIHCGVNDVATGRTWANVSADLDAIKALLVNGERLILDEILPWTAGTDGNASTIRTWNANLATWCSANNATLNLCHDAMGQTRVSTGQLDDLITAYDQDGVHLKQAGVDQMASIARTTFGLA